MNRTTHRSGFTLIELLVSMAILAMIVMIMVSMVSQTTSIWSKTTGKVEQFREAREAYEAMTRRISQATINTYWDYDSPTTPKKYLRQSELRFLSGREFVQAGTTGNFRPTDAVFFFAPLGFVENSRTTSAINAKYRGLDNLLNVCGYFIEYNDDAGFRPSFTPTSPNKRFRLMESIVPAQLVNIYSLEAAMAPGQKYTARDWIYGTPDSASSVGYTYTTSSMHVLGENIVALLVLPKLSKADIQHYNALGKNYNDSSLAPGYGYSSASADTTDPVLNPANQIPPVVQVVMVAIDEQSAKRMSDSDNNALLTKLHSLFTISLNLEADLYGDPNNPSKSEATDSLSEYLTRKRINYRVFNTDVSIRGAKWSTEQMK